MIELLIDRPLPPPPCSQSRAYVLFLNPMRGRCEERRMICSATSAQEIADFIRGELLQGMDTSVAPSAFSGDAHTFRHAFREGPLRWFNLDGEIVQAEAALSWRERGAMRLEEALHEETGR